MMLTIPQVRTRLFEKSIEHNYPELGELARQTFRRRSHFRRARAKCRSITPELAESVRAMKRANPDMPYDKNARRHGINIGRVSEILTGFRQ